jgi:hypothetical protein
MRYAIIRLVPLEIYGLFAEPDDVSEQLNATSVLSDCELIPALKG